MGRASTPPSRANRLFRTLHFIGRGLFRLLFRVRVEGLDRLPPKGGYVLICNHLSWIDPLILMAHLPQEPRIHYLAAAEYTVNGPWLVRKVVEHVGGIIPVDRASQRGNRTVVVESLRVLKGGGILGIFPEGMCGTQEGHVLPLKGGAASFAAKTGSPLLVLGMSGTFALYFRKRITIRVGPLLEAREGETQDDLLDRLAEAIPPVDPRQPRYKLMSWLSRLF